MCRCYGSCTISCGGLCWAHPPAWLALTIVHELGHALVARNLGLQVHAIKLQLLGGVCEDELPWSELDDVLIAWSGVLAQIIVLAVMLPLSHLAPSAPAALHYVLQPLFVVFIIVNSATCVINLLPVAPLDGHRAWRTVPWLWNRRGTALRRKRQKKPLRAAQRSAEEIADELLERLRNKP